MGVAGLRFTQSKRTIRVRAAIVGLVEELPFICPVAVAVGSTVMIVIKFCKDLPHKAADRPRPDGSPRTWPRRRQSPWPLF
jgi:hypothetical protein